MNRPDFSENRPDFSEFVGHFTKDAAPYNADKITNDEEKKLGGLSALEKLTSILEMKKIIATPMPWTNKSAVAFTECPWSSMLAHARKYSPHAVGFTKAHLFAAGGGPAIYMRQDLYDKQRNMGARPGWGWHAGVHAFVTPFRPRYAPASVKSEYPEGKKQEVDYTHEREWRVPRSFTFRLDQVAFVILDTYGEMAAFPKQLKDEIGRDKFILMENYRNVERLWPTHWNSQRADGD